MGNIDAGFKPEIFRKNHPVILACNRHQALLLPVRLRYQSGGYLAGQVLARNTVDGLFQPYVDGAASGTGDAAGILHDDIDMPTADESQTAIGIFGGQVYESKLTGLDAAAKVDLKSRSITDAEGTTILKF